MKKIKGKRYILIIWGFVVVFFVMVHGCTKGLTSKTVVYFNDFEQSDLKGISLYDALGAVNAKFDKFNGSTVLGRFNNNAFRVILHGLPSHNSINVEFTLYIHDKWEGNLVSSSGVPDVWVMQAENNPILITTFSNTYNNRQAFPNYYQAGTGLPAKANADDTTFPGACLMKDIPNNTSSYKITRTLAHSDSTFTFQCNDAIQPFNMPCLKSWSIDNLSITAITY